MPTVSLNSNLRVVVVDDDPIFVETLVAQFKRQSIHALGISTPADLLQSTQMAPFADFDMIFLDMRLGNSKSGEPITAADILLHLMTYASAAKVVVFTQADISAAECVRCIQLGALGIIPKTPDIDHFILVGEVYRHVGNEERAREERIRSLWAKLENAPDSVKGQYLEMLMMNIFNSIDGFKVVGHNKEFKAGEIDLLVENRGGHPFWKELESLHLAIECKNRSSRSEKEHYNVLESKVRTKDMCNAGILVSWKGVSSGFRELQRARGATKGPRIYFLNYDYLFELVRLHADKREEYLRRILSQQL